MPTPRYTKDARDHFEPRSKQVIETKLLRELSFFRVSRVGIVVELKYFRHFCCLKWFCSACESGFLQHNKQDDDIHRNINSVDSYDYKSKIFAMCLGSKLSLVSLPRYRHHYQLTESCADTEVVEL